MKNIAILGATGSIGTQTLDVIRRQREEFKLTAVSANTNHQAVIDIIDEFRPLYVCLTDSAAESKVREYCLEKRINIEILDGRDGMNIIAASSEVDMVVTSIVGMIGLVPTLTAIRDGKDIALANKETLVVAGELVMSEAKKYNVRILPVDSEHSAIFQCLQGNEEKTVNKIILTASGGPFRGRTLEELRNVPARDALKHPNWKMGAKITIDSATLMNKGLEVIEAHWLFGKGYEDIDVVVHPQSVIHSMVEYCDGSIMAQLGPADMRLPIQYALNYPVRKERVISRLDFAAIGSLTFEKPDIKNFRCLDLAYKAGATGKLMPAVLNGANEVCVEMYLNGVISFVEIANIIEECMSRFDFEKEVSVDNIIQLDNNVREYIKKRYN